MYRYVQVYTGMYRYIQVCTGIYRYVQVYTGIYRYVQVYTCIYRYVQVYTGRQIRLVPSRATALVHTDVTHRLTELYKL